ncbi:MAG: T9SS type A sorting domain-containing protein [Flavobacteriales bacterium]|nr:T9SS type A sorting domain-containing protein [Flavobacteriales bacterium]
MKKIYSLLAAMALTAIAAIAQPTLTTTNFVPAINDNQLYHVADTNSLLDPTTGANVVFNYSGLRGYSITQNQFIVNPSITTYGASFPTATYADTSNATATNTRYAQVMSTDSLINVGLVANVPGYGDIVAQYNMDPEIAMKFPFNYADSYNDNYAGTFSLLGQNTNAAGNATVNADAWGQLILPLGVTIDSVLRVRTTEYLITDTIKITFPPITINPVEIQAEYINYYKPSLSKFPILSFINGTIKQDGNLLDSNRTFLSQYSLPGVGIEELDESKLGLSIYPNPTNGDDVTVSMEIPENTMLKIDLLNGLGQQVKQVYNNSVVKGSKQIEVTTKALPQGIYFLNIQLGQKSIAKKIIVQ